MKDRKLHNELIEIAHKLPTSTENESAFIVKHVNDSPNNIGWYLMKDSLVSIEHIRTRVRRRKPEEIEEELKEKKKKKKTKIKINNSNQNNHVNNYGLSAVGINSSRSNMPFDEWIRENPQAYWTIPNYMSRIIELFKEGVFKKVGLDKSYIPNFAKRIAEDSPKEKPIILNISKMNN